MVKATPPTMTLGRRHSGTGMPLLALSLRLYHGCCRMTTTPAKSSPTMSPKKHSPDWPLLKPCTPVKTRGYAVRKR